MPDTIHLKVLIYGAPSLALESRELTVELSGNATTEDLLNQVTVPDKDHLYVVRDGIRLTPTSKLSDGDEILIVPPIAGGA